MTKALRNMVFFMPASTISQVAVLTSSTLQIHMSTEQKTQAKSDRPASLPGNKVELFC